VPVFNPIVSDRKLRRFGVLDLEWVPGETLPTLVNTEMEIEGIRDTLRIPLPVRKRLTGPLQLRLAGYYDFYPEKVEEGDDPDAEPEMVERYRCFSTIRELLNFILVRENRGNWFFAHAGGLADMQFVLDELLTEIKAQAAADGVERSSTVYSADGKKKTVEHKSGPWQIKASFSGSSAIIVHVIHGKNAWHFCDSYWLLRDKLASIGKAIGIKKGDAAEAKAWMSERFGRPINDFEELSQVEKTIFYANVPFEILKTYNKTDCEILWKAIAQFEEEIVGLGGQLQQTIASTAMNLFRRAFLKRDIFTSESLNKIAQDSYFASRVEVISRNAEDFLIYDINSSFPYSMTFPLPGNLMSYQNVLPDNDSDECIYLANVTIEVPDMHLPPLPYRKDNRVFFPVGRWRSWFTSTDIRLALENGAILHKVHEVYLFEPFMDFSEYAKKIYALRAEAKTDFRKLVLKYLLNSLYGKTAESTQKQEMLINPEEIDRSTMQMLQPGVWLCEKPAVIAHRHVVVASVITSLARRTLYNYAKMCYEQDKPFYYCDSVTPDRTVVLKSPSGDIVIEPIEDIWIKHGQKATSYRNEKEACDLPGWSALAKAENGTSGWFPVKRLIRHLTNKDVHLISSKRGQVEVTSDHSIMVGGKQVKPADFLADNLQFETVKAPPVVVREKVDLYEYVKDFQFLLNTDCHHGDEINHRFDVTSDGDWIRYRSFRDSEILIRRYYKSNSLEFRRLLRVLAAFVAEGSSSFKGITTSTRSMFSLSQKNEKWLLDLKEDLLGITKGLELTGPNWDPGSGVYYLRSGTNMMAALFGTLGGMMGSADRKLPSFIYDLSREDFHVFWEKLMDGDGSRCQGEAYTTISQKLAAGLSFLLDQHGNDHGIHYRPLKKSYTLRIRPPGSERARWTNLHEEKIVDGYVYDLEVEGAHTFVDGVGRVLLHNTDSLATKADLPIDDKKLGMLKLEKKMDWAEFVAPKIYRGEGLELLRDGTWKEKKLNKAKGFSLGYGMAAFEKLDKIIAGDRIGVQRMTRLRELYRTMSDGQYTTAPFELLVIKALTFEMLSKRFHYPDGETRPWSVGELKSGSHYPKGFDFEREITDGFDTVTKAMLAAAV
jgi:hypothetical protein